MTRIDYVFSVTDVRVGRSGDGFHQTAPHQAGILPHLRAHSHPGGALPHGLLMSLPASKAQAIASGQKKYFTGRPCKHGHVAPRYTCASSCSECVRIGERAWAQKNPERKREIRKATSSRERSLERSRRQYYAKTKEEIRQRKSDWRRRNPDKQAALRRAQKAKRRGAEGRYHASDIDNLLEAQQSLCALCNAQLIMCGRDKYHIDHVIPISKGGTNWPYNLQLLCPPCNRAKRDDTLYGH